MSQDVKKLLTVIAPFVLMLCLGGIYAWSIFASELIVKHGFSAAQSQIIFGLLIAVFPVTMVFAGRLAKRIPARGLGYISGVLFLSGYLLAGASNGKFIPVLLGIGILAGMGTGFGYWVSLTIPVQWFPRHKGLITGIAAAGFGLGAVILSNAAETILASGISVFGLFNITGWSYGLVIILFSNLIWQNNKLATEYAGPSVFLKTKLFKKLVSGIFLGTFAGLLIIGSLKMIGEQNDIPGHILVSGVSLFAVANFSGRLSWGFLSDRMSPNLCIFLALTLQSAGILLLGLLPLSGFVYLVLSALIGFGFGGNFVLFARETARVFGLPNLGLAYPYVFLGYAAAGVAGPLSGGLLFDLSGSHVYSVFLASFISLCGGILFLFYPLSATKPTIHNRYE